MTEQMINLSSLKLKQSGLQKVNKIITSFTLSASQNEEVIKV